MSKVPSMAARAKPVNTKFQIGPWTITATTSHILESEGLARQRFESQLELPQLPEMIFADNILRVQHDEGYGVEFNALDAMKLVDAHHDPLKVAVSQAWREARAGCKHINDVIKPFDWTFTTDYTGTLFGKDDKQLKIIPSEEKIDLEKLKVREKILFYEDILLFEDELSDNGTSIMNVKIRVMPTSFFILLRQFMRVDGVIVRVLDTRLYFEADKKYIIREHCCRDDKIADIKAPAHIVTNPNEVSNYLTVRTDTCEKLLFPESTQTLDSNTSVK